MKVFVEEQRFTQWWLYLILLLPIFILLVEFKLNNGTDSVASLIVGLLGLLFIILLLVVIKLRTKIDEIGIHYQFTPIQFSEKHILWKDIRKCYVKKYNPLVEFGGWGFKGGVFWNVNKGTAYNVKGNIGLQLHLKNGKKFLIGTQKESEIKRVLQTYAHKISNHEN